MKRSLPVVSSSLAAVLFAVLGMSPPALAEPFLALREGYKCSQCHVNRTGGGMRNSFGVVYAQTRLPTTVLGVKEEAADSASFPQTGQIASYLRQGALFDSFLTDRVTIGGDFRARLTKSFAPEAKDDLSFDVQEGRMFLQFELQPDHVSFYVDETLGPVGASSREIFALVHDLPLDSYVKAGKILLPYGIRVFDDNSFIREATGINYNTPDKGIEIGMEPGPYSLALAVTNGTAGGPEDNQAKQISLVNSLVFDTFRVGGSLAYNPTSTGRRFLYGTFGGVQVGRLGVMGEIDFIRDQDKQTKEVTRNLASFVETDFEVYQGVNLRVVLDFLDPDTSIAENARTRVSVGAQWFLTPSVELSVFYRDSDSVPQHPQERVDFLIAELHLFF